MKKILKLCLLASITSTSGYIDAMAATLVGDVQGFKIEAGAADDKPGAVAEVAGGKEVKNWSAADSVGKDVTDLTYVAGVAIEVEAGSCDETSSGSKEIQAGALTGIITGSSESAGTVTGYVVRHHDGDGLEWETTDQSAPCTYTIKSDPFSMHGFISDSLTLTDAKGEEDPGNKFYEAIDSDNKLYRLYRDIPSSDKKIASGDTAKLSVAVSKASMVPTADVSIGGATLNHYGYNSKKIGKVIYVNSSAVKSIDPQKAFAIDLYVDSDSTASYSIDANLLNGNGSDTKEDITSLSVNTGTKGLSFTGANNFAGYDTTNRTNGAGKGSLVDLNIGNATVKGSVTFGGSGTSDNGAATAMKGIGNVTVTNDGSVLKLTKGTDTELTTAGDWKFVGTASLVAGIPMVIAVGTKCTLGAVS